jgi:hypothetical protein
MSRADRSKAQCQVDGEKVEGGVFVILIREVRWAEMRVGVGKLGA